MNQLFFSLSFDLFMGRKKMNAKKGSITVCRDALFGASSMVLLSDFFFTMI